MEKIKYLIENDCPFGYENCYGLDSSLESLKDFFLLDFFVGKNSSFDNRLLKHILKEKEVWFEGIDYLLEKGNDIQKFKSIEEVFHVRQKIDAIKYFHSLGLPWCLDSSRNTQLLSEIACYNDILDVIWAYDNGCHGGHLVQYVKKEWEKNGVVYYVKDEWENNGIRQREEWKANQFWFELYDMLDDTFLAHSEHT